MKTVIVGGIPVQLEERVCKVCKATKFRVMPKSKQITCSIDCEVIHYDLKPTRGRRPSNHPVHKEKCFTTYGVKRHDSHDDLGADDILDL